MERLSAALNAFDWLWRTIGRGREVHPFKSVFLSVHVRIPIVIASKALQCKSAATGINDWDTDYDGVNGRERTKPASVKSSIAVEPSAFRRRSASERSTVLRCAHASPAAHSI